MARWWCDPGTLALPRRDGGWAAARVTAFVRSPPDGRVLPEQDDLVYDFETSYRAMASRDQRFDGHFVVAVTSTVF